MEQKHFDISLSGDSKPGLAITILKAAELCKVSGYAIAIGNRCYKIEAEGEENQLKQFLGICQAYQKDNKQIQFEEKDLKGFREFSIAPCDWYGKKLNL
jgi:hypothetical protein